MLRSNTLHSLLVARGIYFPDPVKATAGIHFMSVLKRLGIDAELASRLQPFPQWRYCHA